MHPDLNLDDIQQLQEDEYNFPYHYVSEYRNGFSQCFNDTWGINYIATIEFILSKLKKENFNSLVDVGCGDGRLTKEIFDHFPNKQVEGLDYSEKAINIAKALNPRLTFTNLNILEESPDRTYDMGVLMEVFEHIPIEIAENFVGAIAALLKPGGVLYVTVPHQNKPLEYKHYRHFSSSLLSDCFKEFFVIDEVIPFEKRNYKKRFIDKILTNRFFILNHSRLKNYLYKYYKQKLFIADEKECGRLFIRCIKK